MKQFKIKLKCLECSHEFMALDSKYTRCHKCSSGLLFDPAKEGKPRVRLYADIFEFTSVKKPKDSN